MQIADCKSTDNKSTLLHLLINSLKKKRPECLELDELVVMLNKVRPAQYPAVR